MHAKLFDRIQQSIYAHGRIRAVRLLTCSEYSVEHGDGFAYVVSDARQAEEGPIQSVELYDGDQQGIATDFRILKSFVLFEGPERQRHDGEAATPTALHVVGHA